MKVALSISRRQKWKSRQQFSKNCIVPNIQLKGVANKLLHNSKTCLTVQIDFNEVMITGRLNIA